MNTGTVTQTTADPNFDYTVKANNYDIDITGYWDNRYRFQVTVDDFQPKPMPLTPQAKAIYDGRTFGDDHVLRCLPAGLPRVETTLLSPGWLDGSGYPMSGGADTRIVERWTPAEDGLTMERIMTVHDTLYTAPLVRTRGSQRGDATLGLIESEPCDARPF